MKSILIRANKLLNAFHSVASSSVPTFARVCPPVPPSLPPSCTRQLPKKPSVREARTLQEALYQRSVRDAALPRELFVCRGSSTGRTEQFRNRINLLPPIGCPRHCRDAREFFILHPVRALLSLRRGFASIVSPAGRAGGRGGREKKDERFSR